MELKDKIHQKDDTLLQYGSPADGLTIEQYESLNHENIDIPLSSDTSVDKSNSLSKMVEL